MSRPTKKGINLTPLQKAFCEEYVKNGYNGMQAYLTASPNCTPETANRAASKLIRKNDEVIKYIKELQQEQFKRACITPERVAMKLAEIAFAEKGDDYYNSNAQLKALDLLQKQYGWQQQTLNIEETKINIVIDGNDEEEG